MGFRTGAIATVWEVKPVTNTSTKMKLSVSKKNKETGEWETEWSGYALAVGTVTASRAASLAKNDKIKLGDVDVTRRYDKESGKEYINWKIFSFAPAEQAGNESRASHGNTRAVDDGEPALPF